MKRSSYPKILMRLRTLVSLIGISRLEDYIPPSCSLIEGMLKLVLDKIGH